MNASLSAATQAPSDPRQITRPDPALMRYYLLVSLLTGPGFFVAILPLWFKYETLRYRFDDEGISMSWGTLFRREVHLTYRRIQDIHLTRNLLQRWMGLATVSVQTASGSSSAEATIEGILAAEELRDFLYAKMRGVREHAGETAVAETKAEIAVNDQGRNEPLELLRDIRDALRKLADRREAEA